MRFNMESDFIAWLRERLPPHPLLRLGPGDDAAILQLTRDTGCVVTVDLLSDGVDFRLSEIDARRAGRKALAVNLSDLAAMAAQPVAAVIALALPRVGGMQLAVELYEGLIPLAERYGVAIAGGDTGVRQAFGQQEYVSGTGPGYGCHGVHQLFVGDPFHAARRRQ